VDLNRNICRRSSRDSERRQEVSHFCLPTNRRRYLPRWTLSSLHKHKRRVASQKGLLRVVYEPSCYSQKMTDDSDEEALDLFQEPEGFYQPEKQPTFVKHRMLNGEELTLRLVGHNPLWVGYMLHTVSFRLLFSLDCC